MIGAGGCTDPSSGQVHTAKLILRSDDLLVGIETSRIAARRERTISVLTEKSISRRRPSRATLDVFKNPTQKLDTAEFAAFAALSQHELGVRLTPISREPLADELAFAASYRDTPDPVLATADDALAVSLIPSTASAMIMEANPAR